MEKVVLEEAMKLDRGMEMSFGNSMKLMNTFVHVTLESDEETHDLFYQAKVEDILNSSMTDGDLIKLVMQGGWEFSPNHENLILIIKP